MRFARSLSHDILAVVVDVNPQATERVRQAWPALGSGVPLVVLESPYRSITGPLLACLDEMDQRDPGSGLTVVVLPELVPARWWHRVLHGQTALFVKTILTYRREHTGRDRVIVSVPYHLRDQDRGGYGHAQT